MGNCGEERFFTMKVVPQIMLVALAALAGGAAAGIYPEGHFDVSAKLTVDTFDNVIQSAIEVFLGFFFGIL